MANAQTFGYDWAKFSGSYDGLRWNRRDLPILDRVASLAKHRRVAVQAGGNLGIFPRRLAETFATVMTFEPSPELFPLLVQNAPADNIIRFQAALGEDHQFVGVSRTRRDNKPCPHEGITHVSGPGHIPTMRIDDLDLQVCDLIQLDIEGWELFALRGAVSTLKRCRPVVCVEINKCADFVGVNPEHVRGLLRDVGYRFVERLKSDEVFVPF